MIATWAPNIKANAAAWSILKNGGRSFDAVEAGARVPEADPDDMSVGYGGLPDRDGRVTLDACIMDEVGNCGAVMCLEHIMHPISVARLVMEKTPHVQLVGEGALRFALENGFTTENLLTDKARAAWQKWLEKGLYNPNTAVQTILDRIENDRKSGIPIELNHDTIGIVALDTHGNMSGACTTSGMAYKMQGRVGDSPIIGAGMYVDNEVGAVAATGVGEEVVKICGSFAVVEQMRQGHDPETAVKIVLERMKRKQGDRLKDIQVGFVALNNQGEFGGYALQKDFSYVVQNSDGGSQVFQAKHLF